MPVSHIGLTVSNLGSSQKFYERVLKPLGYRVFREERDQVAFGVNNPDFFICQDSSCGWPSGTHIAFGAQSTAEVDAFYLAALRAGGCPRSSPKRCGVGEATEYSASIIDVDNNAVEVTSGNVILQTMSQPCEAPRSQAGSGMLSRVPLQAIVNNLASNMASPNVGTKPQPRPESKTVVGTLLGAAAGAAIAYAMTKDESPKQDHDSGVREVLVHHTVEYRRPIEDNATYSSASQATRPDESHAGSHRSMRKNQSPRSEYSIESLPSSQTVRPRPSPLALPEPPSPPSLSHTHGLSHSRRQQHDASTKSSHRYAENTLLPTSPRASITSSRRPEAYPLPLSAPASAPSMRSPRDVPLPPSTRTSFLSHRPSPPRSERSAATPSIVRPLTARNIARINAGSSTDEGVSPHERVVSASERACGSGWDDLGTVVPEDSISKASKRTRRTKREGHERREKKRTSASKAGSSASQPLVPLARSSVKVFGFGG